MARIPVDNLGAAGVIADIYAHDTPPEAWTLVRNARMGPYGAEKFLGHSRTLGTSTGWAVAPYAMFYAPVPGGVGYWVAGGAAKIYARTAQTPYTESNLTRQPVGVDVDYAATETKKWNGGLFGGLLIMNNGVDLPQVWDPAVGASRMQDYDDYGSPWPTTYRAAVIRPFGRFLVAIDITKNGARYPQLVKWSHPADPGAMPSSWDETNAAVDAGEYPLQDARGVLVDQRILRNTNLLYTTDQVWQMRHTGGGDIFGFDALFHEQGALAAHCIARFKKQSELHLVLGGDDIFVHNGQSAESAITPAMRRWFFQQIDSSHYQRSFVVPNPRYSEVWVCVPENGMEQPTLALVWNWETGAIGFRDLLKATSNGDARSGASTYGTPFIAAGFVDDVDDATWDSDSGSWETDTTQWDARTSSPAVPRLLMLDRSAGKRTFLLDDTTQFDGASFAWTLERTGLAIIGRDRQGSAKNDTELVKLLTEIWPRVEAVAGTQVSVYVGTQEMQDAPVSWSSAYTYTVGTDHFVSVYHSGRYLSVRYTHAGAEAIRMPGYALEITGAGRYN